MMLSLLSCLVNITLVILFLTLQTCSSLDSVSFDLWDFLFLFFKQLLQIQTALEALTYPNFHIVVFTLFHFNCDTMKILEMML